LLAAAKAREARRKPARLMPRQRVRGRCQEGFRATIALRRVTRVRSIRNDRELGEPKSMTRAGLEPATYGLKVRCSTS
jgi:hypothetical protein